MWMHLLFFLPFLEFHPIYHSLSVPVRNWITVTAAMLGNVWHITASHRMIQWIQAMSRRQGFCSPLVQVAVLSHNEQDVRGNNINNNVLKQMTWSCRRNGGGLYQTLFWYVLLLNNHSLKQMKYHSLNASSHRNISGRLSNKRRTIRRTPPSQLQNVLLKQRSIMFHPIVRKNVPMP